LGSTGEKRCTVGYGVADTASRCGASILVFHLEMTTMGEVGKDGKKEIAL